MNESPCDGLYEYRTATKLHYNSCNVRNRSKSDIFLGIFRKKSSNLQHTTLSDVPKSENSKITEVKHN